MLYAAEVIELESPRAVGIAGTWAGARRCLRARPQAAQPPVGVVRAARKHQLACPGPACEEELEQVASANGTPAKAVSCSSCRLSSIEDPEQDCRVDVLRGEVLLASAKART